MESKDYHVGEIVEVHAFGHWYRGEVVKVGPKRVVVRYTNGRGNTRNKSGSPHPYRSEKYPDYEMPQLVRKIGEMED